MKTIKKIRPAIARTKTTSMIVKPLLVWLFRALSLSAFIATFYS